MTAAATEPPVPPRPVQAGAELSPGLCGRCAYRRVNTTRRGTTYLRCTRAGWDDRLPKYPTLPVRACVGFRAD